MCKRIPTKDLISLDIPLVTWGSLRIPLEPPIFCEEVALSPLNQWLRTEAEGIGIRVVRVGASGAIA